MKKRVGIIGDTAVDFVYVIDKLPNAGGCVVTSNYSLRPGGSLGYAAIGLRALGVEVKVLCNVGDDFLSKFWLKTMGIKYGVDTSSVRILKVYSIGTGAVFLLSGNRSFVTFYGASAEPILNLSVNEVKDCDVLFLSGFMQAPGLWSMDIVRFLEDAKNLGITIFLDTNYVEDQQAVEMLKFILPLVDIFFPNKDELLKISAASNIEEGVRRLSYQYNVETVVVTLADRGCWIYSESNEINKHIEVERIEPVDANGAGDFFAAGFIAAYLETHDLVYSATFANKCAITVIKRFLLEDKFEDLKVLSCRNRKTKLMKALQESLPPQGK